jgi:hypothetical protein
MLLVLGGDVDVEPGRPSWTDPAFGGLVLNAARLQPDMDGRVAPLDSWSTCQGASDGSRDQLLEFLGDSYGIYSGTVKQSRVLLFDRWVRLTGAPPVVVPVPAAGGPGSGPGSPVPVPVDTPARTATADAAPRCAISVGAWERCSPIPQLWETDLRLRLPDVDFRVLDALERVCPWQAPAVPALAAGAGAGSPGTSGLGGPKAAPVRALPPIRVERGVVTFPEQHAWDVLVALLPWLSQSVACRGCPASQVTADLSAHVAAGSHGAYPPAVWTPHHKPVYGGAQRSKDITAALEAVVVRDAGPAGASTVVVVGPYRVRRCTLLCPPGAAAPTSKYVCVACSKWPDVLSRAIRKSCAAARSIKVPAAADLVDGAVDDEVDGDVAGVDDGDGGEPAPPPEFSPNKQRKCHHHE